MYSYTHLNISKFNMCNDILGYFKQSKFVIMVNNPIVAYQFISYLKKRLGLQSIVIRLQRSLSQPKTNEIYYDHMAGLVASCI